MSPGWMLQALLAGTLLGLGALAAERVAGWLGLPRRPVWAAAMLGSLLLPALSLWAPGLLPDPGIFPVAAPPVPAFEGALPLASSGPASPADVAATSARAWWTDLSVMLGLGWLAASLAMLGVVGWTYRRLRAARAGGIPMELDGAGVRVTERVGPAVVGLLHPAVVVPRWVLDAPAEERRLVLLHEREHVAAGDAWLLFLSTLVVAAMPWSVPLWWQHRRLRAAVETDCDARVLARGASRRAYGRVLIRTAGCAPGLPLLGPTWGDTTSQLERRIIAMTTKRPSRPLLRSLPLVALVAAVTATACDIAGTGESRSVTTPAPAYQPVIHTDTMAVGPLDPSRPLPKASTGFEQAFPISITGRGDEIRTRDYLRVARVRPGTGAARAGIQPGDEILAVNGLDGKALRSWVALVTQEPGTRYSLRVRRNGVERDVVATLDTIARGKNLW